MKTTLDLPDQLVEAVKLTAVHDGMKFRDAMADLLRKGMAASAKKTPTVVHADKAMLQRRKEMTRKFVAGEWGLELSGYEQARKVDRSLARKKAEVARL